MDEFIAKTSIEHLKQLVMSETDAHKRRALENLLAEKNQNLLPRLSVGTREKRADRASSHSRQCDGSHVNLLLSA